MKVCYFIVMDLPKNDLLKLVTILGDAFRGLWTNIEATDPEGKVFKKQHWSVTYLLQNDYVETPGQDSPEEAFVFAINMIEKYNNG
jgi:hypothetical protein